MSSFGVLTESEGIRGRPLTERKLVVSRKRNHRAPRRNNLFRHLTLVMNIVILSACPGATVSLVNEVEVKTSKTLTTKKLSNLPMFHR